MTHFMYVLLFDYLLGGGLCLHAVLSLFTTSYIFICKLDNCKTSRVRQDRLSLQRVHSQFLAMT